MKFNKQGNVQHLYYMRSTLRLIECVQYIPHSSLRNHILSVDIVNFELENVNEEKIKSFKKKIKLVTNV